MGLAVLALTPYWLIQSARQGKYLANLGERLGFSFPGIDGGVESATGSTAGVEEAAAARRVAGAGSSGGAEKAAGLRPKRPALQGEGAIWQIGRASCRE